MGEEEKLASILLVDDDPDALSIFSGILVSAGHAVVSVRSGLAALDALDAGGRFDLLLTDVIMPGLNGLNLARMMRLRRSSLKVLYLSCECDAVERDQGERHGKLLEKPIMPSRLRREVSAALGSPTPPTEAMAVPPPP